MDTVKYILGKPEFIEGVGDIHPIRVKEYDEFSECSTILQFRKEHFEGEIKDFHLLDLLVIGLKDESVVKNLETLFTLVTRKKATFVFNEDEYAFMMDINESINSMNFDNVRSTIMKQNLIFEQKIYKNPLVAEWSRKVLESKAKNGVKITIEDMISTVSIVTGKSYEQIGEQTIYQLNSDFTRISKDKDYHSSIAMKCAGADINKIGHFAEEINLFQNPYDNLFVDKNKLSKLDSAVGNT